MWALCGIMLKEAMCSLKALLWALCDTCRATSHRGFMGRYVTRARSHKAPTSSLLN
ncbi:hypothetical protein HanPSC8_Chr12g0508991 [Helianthus annuus]|nr:hypothetical protein HanPSC8_Chr12g0508991 [Helianthus annuus]